MEGLEVEEINNKISYVLPEQQTTSDEEIHEISLDQGNQEIILDKGKEVITIKNNYEDDIKMIETELQQLQDQMTSLQTQKEEKTQELFILQKKQEEPEFEYVEN